MILLVHGITSPSMKILKKAISLPELASEQAQTILNTGAFHRAFFYDMEVTPYEYDREFGLIIKKDNTRYLATTDKLRKLKTFMLADRDQISFEDIHSQKEFLKKFAEFATVYKGSVSVRSLGSAWFKSAFFNKFFDL